MEFDILNSLLTSTVDSLFASPDSSLNESRPSSMAPELKLEPAAAMQKREEKIDIPRWLSTNGKKWLEDAMARLRVDHSKVTGRELASKTLEQLMEEKSKVKNELKKYDSNFMSLFHKQPGRDEKEPMRPLYVYYKKLKIAITKCQQRHPSLVAHSRTQPTAPREDPKHPAEKKAFKALNNWTFKNNEEIATKMSELKGERAQLRTILDKFQQDFIRTYNRKIKYNKDIAPVAEEFKHYKELKKTILKLEELFSAPSQ